MKNKIKLFISADMEGITGVIDWNETEGNNPDYQYFRKVMTDEVNAAIEGAIEKGVTDVTVRDAHGTARNLLPDQLHEEAKLLRSWSNSPYSMMEGINSSFSAVICIGYHAKAMSADGTLAHTMSGNILDFRVNSHSLPELGWNALIAGYYNVPVIFVSGDKAICEQATHLIPSIHTVVVKEGIGEASLNLHPQKARKLIKSGVKESIDKLDNSIPLKFNPPFTAEIDFKKKGLATRASWYPGAKRIGDFTIKFVCNDFFDCMRFFYLVH